MYLRLFLIGLISIFFASCQGDEVSEEVDGNEETEEVIESLPFQEVSLNGLEGFQSPAENWSVVGQVISDYTKEKDIQVREGSGILVNQPTEEAKDNLLTTWEHQDLELTLSFMMPKGSNSGIYLQGRYEVQLFDSWMKEELGVADCGAIYERWDKATQKGYEGHIPPINATKAPGLWQDLYIRFTAPRFDENGEKVSNAKFDRVELNGMVLHENVELTGPTRASVAEDEVAFAPLMIQGDHGPVAFKNIEFKSYINNPLKITDLKYDFYAINHALSQLPDFDTLEVTSSGAIDSFEVTKVSPQENEFAIRYTGLIQVEKPGEYLVHLRSDDGSRLSIDGKEFILNDFNHGVDEVERGLINLTEGSHPFQLDYYNNRWGKGLILMYEGPDIKYQALASKPFPEDRFSQIKPLLINIKDRPELLRGFLNYGEEKRTHIISVGQPDGIHYAIDLSSGALIKFWRGGFADVAEMWRGRGQRQLIKPLALAIDGLDAPIALKTGSNSENGLKLDRYELDANGYPEFFFNVEGATISQKITSSDSNLSRVVSIVEGNKAGLQTLIAKADYIEQIENGYYSVGGDYYIKVDMGEDGISIRDAGQQKEMFFSFDEADRVQYSILW